MDIETFKQKLDERNRKINAFNEILRKDGKEVLAGLFQPLFDIFPELESFGWAQYPVYDDNNYNFEVLSHLEAIWINDAQLHDIEDNDPSYAWREQVANKISDALSELTDDDYKLLFGENSKIVVTKKELTIEGYYT